MSIIVPSFDIDPINGRIITPAHPIVITLRQTGELRISIDNDDDVYCVVRRVTLASGGPDRTEWWDRSHRGWGEPRARIIDHACPVDLIRRTTGALPINAPGIYEIDVVLMRGRRPAITDPIIAMSRFYRDVAGEIHSTSNDRGGADYSIPIADEIVDRVLAESPKVVAILSGLADAVEGAA